MIDIVIVNWNSGTQLRDCIDSVRKFGMNLVGKCIVIDNGSIDGSTSFLSESTDVDLVLTGRNLGFAAACNLGAARGSSKYILLLNPDACLKENSLSASWLWMENPQHLDTGIVGVQLVGENNQVQRTCAHNPTYLRLVAKSFGITTLFKVSDFQMKTWNHAYTRQVGQVMGAFFFVRRKIWEDLNGLDQRFFVYFEEVDFSYRAKKLGFTSVYLSEGQAWHKGGGVSEQVKAHRLFYSLRSRIQYSFKHFSFIQAIAVSLSALLIEPVSRICMLSLRRRWREIPDIVHGYRMLWLWGFQRIKGRA